MFVMVTRLCCLHRATNFINIWVCFAIYLYPEFPGLATVLILAIANGINAVVLLTTLIVCTVLYVHSNALRWCVVVLKCVVWWDAFAGIWNGVRHWLRTAKL